MRQNTTAVATIRKSVAAGTNTARINQHHKHAPIQRNLGMEK
jgi:hypothetical protein